MRETGTDGMRERSRSGQRAALLIPPSDSGGRVEDQARRGPAWMPAFFRGPRRALRKNPGTRERTRRALASGVVFFWFVFFWQQKKMNERPKGAIPPQAKHPATRRKKTHNGCR